MTVFDLMTGGDEENINQAPTEERKAPLRRDVSMDVKDKIEFYSDFDSTYENIAMPEVPVTVYFEGKNGKQCGVECVTTKMKLARVLRYQHLGRDFVDEEDYPPSQEYFLYADRKVHCLTHQYFPLLLNLALLTTETN